MAIVQLSEGTQKPLKPQVKVMGSSLALLGQTHQGGPWHALGSTLSDKFTRNGWIPLSWLNNLIYTKVTGEIPHSSLVNGDCPFLDYVLYTVYMIIPNIMDSQVV